MEYCRGGNLRKALDYEMFKEKAGKFIMACIVEAVEHVHKKNIVHRDIKPNNLLFTDKGYLMLSDFGLATDLKEGQKLDSITFRNGTKGYMAPEIFL